MPKNPHDLVWWKDEDGNLQQMMRHAVEAAHLDWTEVTKGFPVDATEDGAAAQAETDTGRKSTK